MSVTNLHQVKRQNPLQELQSIHIGNEYTLQRILVAALSGGHVLLESYVGLGKTEIAKKLAEIKGGTFKRVQMTADMMPKDILGYVDAKSGELVKGPVFCNVLLADEINRATPQVQSALLEVMAEQQVTINGVTHSVNVVVIATMNPVEFEGTYPLPEAQLDRFMIKESLNYPTAEQMGKILDVHMPQGMTWQDGAREIVLHTYQNALLNDHIDGAISPRGILQWLKAATGYARGAKCDYITRTDILFMAEACLAHRISLTEDAIDDERITPSRIIQECLPEPLTQ